MIMKNVGYGSAVYSNLCADSGGSNVEHSLPSYDEAVGQEFSHATSEVNNEDVATNSEIDNISSHNENPNVPNSQYGGSHQIQLKPNDNRTYVRRNEPNMCLINCITMLVISFAVLIIVYVSYLIPI